MQTVPSNDSAHEQGISVVVCCYNSVDRLPPTLAHLARQRVNRGVRWEVVVVDNASTDATSQVAAASWHQHGCSTLFRVVHQPEPGLSAARARGLDVARYGLVVFCDDDNWLAEDYVQIAFDTMGAQPRAAVIGGQGTAEIADEAPPWFARYANYYALGPQGDASGDITNAKGYVYGAGLVLRRSAWDALRERGFASQLTGRKGDVLSSSEDRELCYALRLLGYHVHYVEGLRFRHEILPRRLKWSYFLTMVEMAHRTSPITEAYLGALRGDPPLDRKVARRYWLRRCGDIAAKVVRKPRVVVAGARRRRVGSGAVQWRRLRGAWTGWRLVGPRFAEVQDAVFPLCGGVRERAR